MKPCLRCKRVFYNSPKPVSANSLDRWADFLYLSRVEISGIGFVAALVERCNLHGGDFIRNGCDLGIQGILKRSQVKELAAVFKSRV